MSNRKPVVNYICKSSSSECLTRAACVWLHTCSKVHTSTSSLVVSTVSKRSVMRDKTNPRAPHNTLSQQQLMRPTQEQRITAAIVTRPSQERLIRLSRNSSSQDQGKSSAQGQDQPKSSAYQSLATAARLSHEQVA